MEWWEWISQLMYVVACIAAAYLLTQLGLAIYQACKALTATCHALQAWLRWTRAAGEEEAWKEGEE